MRPSSAPICLSGRRQHASACRRALASLLGEAHLSKSAVSRVVGRLKALFADWDQRDLNAERYGVLHLDAINLRVRLVRRVVVVPVPLVLGVEEDGSI